MCLLLMPVLLNLNAVQKSSKRIWWDLFSVHTMVSVWIPFQLNPVVENLKRGCFN